MIENLIVAWLTDATERSYEVPFSQLLLIEGFRVIQGPMHHAHEHGKDIIAYGPAGTLDVFQLKSGSHNLSVADVEDVQPQLHAAATAVVTHPSLRDPRRPDRVFLVTNQKATGPAQGRLRVLSDGYSQSGGPPLLLVERDDLLSRFVQAQHRFFPSDPTAVEHFLGLFLDEGTGPISKERLFKLLDAIIPVTGKKPRAAAAARLLSSAGLTTAFALRPWTESDNHYEVAIGWTCYCVQLLRLVERTGLGVERWQRSFALAFEEIRRRAEAMTKEASESGNLVVGHPGEVFTYPARVVNVCGMASALVLSEAVEFGASRNHLPQTVTRLIKRELEGPKILGEVQAPSWFLMSLALSNAGDYRLSVQLLFAWIDALVRANQPGSEVALPDPYHEVTEIILNQIEPESDHLKGEQFGGSAYTLHVAVRWAARRLWRQSLAQRWQSITRIQLNNFRPKYPIQYLYSHSRQGTLTSWYYPQPTSWRNLREDAKKSGSHGLPGSLRKRPEFLPFYCLCLPHRFNSAVADFLDELVSGPFT